MTTSKRICRMVGKRRGGICVMYVQYIDGEVERFTFVKGALV